MVWVYSGAGVVAVLLILIVWATASENRKTKRLLREITIDDIDPLIRECIVTFSEKLGLQLDLNDLEGSTRILDDNVGTPALRQAFAKGNFNSYFIMPVGAFFGELIRHHRDAGWQEEEEGSLSVWIKDEQEEKTIQPFEMVQSHGFAKKSTVFTNLFTHVFPCEESVESDAGGMNVQLESSGTEGISDGFVAEESVNLEISDLEKRVERGANWFIWIAGLSLVNSILFLADIEWGFIFGLGITQIIDVIAVEIGGEGNYLARIVAFGLDVIAASIFALFGFISKKERRWAFVVGMSLYGLDGMLFLLVGDFLGLGFHCIGLYGIFMGCKASWTLRARIEYESTVPSTFLKPMAVSLDERIDPNVRRAKVVWPIVVTTISLIYAIMYALVNVRHFSNYWKLAACVFLFGGVLGTALKRKGGVILLLIGATLVLARLVYGIVVSAAAMREPPSSASIVGLLILLLVFATWPSFLIIWFLRKSIRTYVKNEWT